jgi:hypothetical protein
MRPRPFILEGAMYAASARRSAASGTTIPFPGQAGAPREAPVIPPSREADAVREDPARYPYEDEGSERRALGSVRVGPRAHWAATLTVPVTDPVALLDLARHGDLPAGYRGAEERVTLSLPVGELDALVGLVTGIVSQARRDGVLTARAGQ